MDPLDSIDGFGMTFADLSEAGQRKLLFRMLKQDRLTEGLVRDLGTQTAAEKAVHDAAQEKFGKVGRTNADAASSTPVNKRSPK